MYLEYEPYHLLFFVGAKIRPIFQSSKYLRKNLSKIVQFCAFFFENMLHNIKIGHYNVILRPKSAKKTPKKSEADGHAIAMLLLIGRIIDLKLFKRQVPLLHHGIAEMLNPVTQDDETRLAREHQV